MFSGRKIFKKLDALEDEILILEAKVERLTFEVREAKEASRPERKPVVKKNDRPARVRAKKA